MRFEALKDSKLKNRSHILELLVECDSSLRALRANRIRFLILLFEFNCNQLVWCRCFSVAVLNSKYKLLLFALLQLKLALSLLYASAISREAVILMPRMSAT